MVTEGQPAPSFTLTADTGEQISLEALRGRPVVLYFYPRDDTPGCTAQACGIRDAWGEFERAGAVVLGVSPDDEASHATFRQKYELPFPLLADTDHSVSEEYGVWREKNMYGKTYWGGERTRLGLDADRTLPTGVGTVSPDTHAPDVLAALPA